MRGFLKYFWIPTITVALSAAPLNLNTGTANWQVTQTSGPSNNGAALNTTTNATILTGSLAFLPNMLGFEVYSWINPVNGAMWVGQLASDGNFSNGTTVTCGSICGATGGFYTYTLTFNGGLGGSFLLSAFTGDNTIRSLRVTASNGTLYSCSIGGPGPLCPATQNTSASSGVLTYAAGGTVTITAVVENIDGPGRNPSGFFLAGSGSSIDPTPTPEPSTYAMLGIGCLAILGSRLARRRS